MNRLRVLKQRAKRGCVGLHKTGKRFVVVTGKFQGDYSAPMSKRAAIQIAARWAMPSAPCVMLVEQGNLQTRVTLFPDGRCTMVERKLEPAIP